MGRMSEMGWGEYDGSVSSMFSTISKIVVGMPWEKSKGMDGVVFWEVRAFCSISPCPRSALTSEQSFHNEGIST